jgi:hypothetical protein
MTNIAYNAYGARIPPVKDGDHLNWLKATNDVRISTFLKYNPQRIIFSSDIFLLW